MHVRSRPFDFLRLSAGSRTGDTVVAVMASTVSGGVGLTLRHSTYVSLAIPGDLTILLANNFIASCFW